MPEECKQEKKRPKTKKGDRKSRNAESCHDDTESIPKTEMTQRVEGSPSSDTPARIKTSKKRERSERDAMLDGSETNATELKPRKHKKRNTIREINPMHRPFHPDPAEDESLSEQSRKGLSYAYERWGGTETWKFNKARQNWLLRNIWSEQAIPESYVGLVIEYLASIRGGAREKLVGECISKTSTSEKSLMESGKPSGNVGDDKDKIVDGSATDKQLGALRAQSLLHALNETAETTGLSNCTS